MEPRDTSRAVGEREFALSDTQRQSLQAAHDALDVLESSLRALPSPGKPEPIDLVLRLRRTIIETFSGSQSREL